jgi:hypothetical protein
MKLDISKAFNVMFLQLTLDVLGGKASCDYACGLKEGDNLETVCRELRNMFEYFRAMRTTPSPTFGTWTITIYCCNVLDVWHKTGGQQRDPLEMIVFCLIVHHLWGRNLTSTTKTCVPWRMPMTATSKQAVRRPRGAHGHHAFTQGGQWLRPQF